MFERFSDRARRIVVHAQEEARDLQHNYIGTEHLLLGLLREPDGLAGIVLHRRGLTLPDARQEVATRVGPGKKPPKGHLPFTPRAKKVLELSLREAIQLGHNYIGTEHLLLGLLSEGKGVAAQIVRDRAGDLEAVRRSVLELVAEATGDRPGGRLPRWRRNPYGAPAAAGPRPTADPASPADARLTPAATTSLTQAAELAGAGPVGSHHLLLAALADSDTAAARALTAAGIDLDRVTAALRHADVTGTSDEQAADRGRRGLRIRVTDAEVTVTATDAEVVALGRAAVAAVGDRVRETGVIQGDAPAGAGFGPLWQALRDTLVDLADQGRSGENGPERGTADAGPQRPG